ncbi:MAG: neutral zinc metallopeptidase [Chitinophagaceae bacterium]|nr:neutral zinc metallopeptidase [Oligoflexus sp.]
MEWRDRRESSNVEDRRGVKAAGVVGGGGILIAIIYALLSGDPSALINQVQNQRQGQPAAQTAQDDDSARFVKVVLADTEDVWSKVFADRGQTYTNPKLVLFTDQIQSGCGVAGSAVGPFYCPADQKVYLDLGFFREMASNLGAKGDFAQAYVVAHEVGHHVQHLLGITSQRSNRGQTEANRESVKIELQADCLAGIWAKDTNQVNHSLEPGDVEEALNAASAVGDDRLQKASRGYVVPDSFTHGSSAQRVASFTKGFQTGDLANCDVSTQLDANR